MDFDIFGISETNLYWKKLRQELQFQERIKNWWNPKETRASFAYNFKGISTLNSIRQSGGTAQISRGNAALKFQGAGQDPARGLGRWVWHLYRGKDNRTLRVITAYRPINHKTTGGIYTVWAQHRRYFNKIGKKNLSPTQAILDDLAGEIRKWKREGDHVILMMDCNDDVKCGAMKDFLLKTDMTEAISGLHGGAAPRTYIEGSKQIDGIFITRSISITAGGFTAFDDGVQGDRTDHRCLWIDIKLESVLGHTMPGPVKYAGRRVKTQDPRVVKKFNSAYKKFAIDHGLSKKIFQLERNAIYPLPPELQECAETIAKLRYQGLEYADKRCRKLFFGKIPYTPQYKRLSNALKFWKFAIKKKEGWKVDSKQLQRIMKKADIKERLKEVMALDPKEMKNRSKEAYRMYRKYLKKADIAREQWLNELAAARADKEMEQRTQTKKGTPRKTKQQATETEIKKISTQEKSRKLFSRISSAIGKENLAGISLISVPDGLDEHGNEKWKEVSSHKDIVSALINTHRNKYHQTEHTPPMTGNLRHQLGYLGIGKDADNALNGQFDEIPGTDKYASLLMKNLKRVDASLPELPVGISGKEYSDGWRKAKEKTSAGGSILHFGHCKAMAQDPQLSDMEAAFLSIPLRSGYAFKQWRKGIDCVLPKKANSFRVDKLRTIVLLEADFNFTNKFVSRKVAKRAEQSGGFAKEQFGSRKRHRAIDHAWNKQLTLDLLRQLKIPGVLAPNDLKSCYDRICHSIASLCMRRQGLAESEAVCMFSTLQHLEHTIRCAYGDSQETYGAELWAVPMQGVYQGNGAGPVIWAVVSSPVLNIMREAGFGTFFKTSISGEDIRFVGYAFVDDTDLIQTAKSPEDTIESVIDEMQKGMNMWEGLISATGGALSLDKGCWWAIDVKWQQDGTWKYKSQQEIEGILYARDFDGIRKPIDRLEVHQAFETLGVFLAPHGNSKESVKKLEEKAKRWAERLRTAHLREQETATALKATILKTLEYPLLTLHLTETQCRAIMKPILFAALPKSKFNRNFCRRTLYGPGSHLGTEIHNLFTSQLIEHVDGILRHGPSTSLSGQLLRGSIEAVKLELGLEGDLFSHSYKRYGHLATDCWVSRTWKEMELADIQIYECTPNLQTHREGDKLIMEKFSAAGIKGKALARLNRCRLRLQVTSLAEMCSGDGTYILKQFLEGHNPMKGSSDLRWPNQGDVDPTMWRTWRRCLKRIFRINRQDKLPIPLGRWKKVKETTKWSAWHDPVAHRTFIRNGTSWRQFQHHPRTFEGMREPSEIHQVDRIPDSVLKACAWITDNRLVYHRYGRYAPTKEEDHPSARTVADTLSTEWSWVLPFLEIPANEDALATALRNGSAMAVADDSTRKNACYGAHDVPGDDGDDHCSYRSELSGILGILLLVHIMCAAHNITKGELIIGCDNLGAGQHAIEYKDLPRPTDNHFDLLMVIHRLRSMIPLELTYKHVEGHQKEKYPGRPLDSWAKLNDNMDALAKAYWEEIHNRPRCQQLPLMPQEWRASVDSIRVCTDFRLKLRRQLEGRLLEKKWTTSIRRKHRNTDPLFSRAQIQQIDFRCIQQAWNRAHGNRRRFISKLSTQFFPVGRYMKRMQFWPKDNCPCCLQRNETTLHMLAQCNDTRVQAHRLLAIDIFETHLRKIRTDSQIRKALLALVRQLLLGRPRQPADEASHLRDAIASQLYIGLPHLLLGRISEEWSPLQHKAYTHYAPWLSGTSWGQKVVTGLWDLAFSIWDHRNTILHTTDVHDDLLDMDKIDQQILEQWHMGPTGIPSFDSYLFRGTSLDELLAKKSIYRREWLASIHCARNPGDPELDLYHPTDNVEATQPTSQPIPISYEDVGEASDSSINDSSSSSSSDD